MHADTEVEDANSKVEKVKKQNNQTWLTGNDNRENINNLCEGVKELDKNRR